MKTLENELSIHRPAWTSEDSTGCFGAFHHLHQPIRQDGRQVSPVRHNHFDRTKGFAKKEDLNV